MLILSNWVENTTLYPPAYIYAGKAQTKTERNAIAICEELYKLSHGNKPNVLAELRDAWNTTLVVSKLNYDKSIKPVVIQAAYDNLLEKAIVVNNRLTEVFKQHQDLNKWKNDHLKVSNSELKSVINAYKMEQLK